MSPAVLIGPHDTAVMVGSKATFSCNINSSKSCLTWRYRPSPDNRRRYVCYKNWSSESPFVQFASPKCEVSSSNDGRTSLLTIIDVQLNDAGLYSCTHCYSDKSSEARLVVIGKKRFHLHHRKVTSVYTLFRVLWLQVTFAYHVKHERII